ncbi:MAG TPA: HAMP domain-containing histidine kinase [Acidimicrobiia bacterium]|nr:HAMP domain-containing histidine kinase [Acidimicrobiia bacterium]
MRVFNRLRARLFFSYLLVIAIGALAMLVVVTFLAPSFFQVHLQRMGHGPAAIGAAMLAEVEEGFSSSVMAALLIGVGVAIIGAGLMAAFVGRRLLRPLEEVREATRKMAGGDYRQRVPLPAEAELAALATDVNTLGEALDQTERRRVQLIGEVAHELRTPLTTIEGYMEGLIDGVLPSSEETFGAIAEEASRLKRLADDLSALSQAEEGAHPLELREADLTELATQAAERLRPQFEYKGVALRLPEGPPLPVRVDPDRISQVFTNILGNALTHTPSGGAVSIEAGTEGDMVWVDITDTGRGIPAEDLARIFERFYRGTGEQTSPGRGIGLTIARGIARAHGGDINATSSGLEQGATFRVTLPALRNHGAQNPKESA